MKGLLIKDFRILGQQKKLGIIYILLAVFIGYSMDGSFLISYLPLIAMILSISTLSYDSHDNGLSFLMTLPDGRKRYAMEKYVFSGIMLLGGWFFAAVIQFVMFFVKKESFGVMEVLGMDIVILPIFMIILSLIIPFMLKFGSEKGRLVMIAIFGMLTLIIVVGKNLVEPLNQYFRIDVNAILESIRQISMGVVIAVVLAVTAVAVLSSLNISNGIMRKKEF